MCAIRSVSRPLVLAVVCLLVGATVAEANPPFRRRAAPPVVYYPSTPIYSPGVRLAPSVYLYPQVSSAPSYYSPVYPYSMTYPYALPTYGGSYYGTWGGTSYYPTYPYYGGYSNYGYSYRFRIR